MSEIERLQRECDMRADDNMNLCKEIDALKTKNEDERAANVFLREQFSRVTAERDEARKECDKAQARASRLAELDPDGDMEDDDMQEALREIESLTVKIVQQENELKAKHDLGHEVADAVIAAAERMKTKLECC